MEVRIPEEDLLGRPWGQLWRRGLRDRLRFGLRDRRLGLSRAAGPGEGRTQDRDQGNRSVHHHLLPDDYLTTHTLWNTVRLA